MLKKLAKYGNSTTLVIDKPILELLNMDESSLVKLTTDGKSLIITPVVAAGKEKVSYGADEAVQAAHAGMMKNASVGPVDPVKFKEMQDDFKTLFEKSENRALMESFSKNSAVNEEYLQAVADLAQKFDPVDQVQEYMRELALVARRFFPEMAEIHKQVEAVGKKHEA